MGKMSGLSVPSASAFTATRETYCVKIGIAGRILLLEDGFRQQRNACLSQQTKCHTYAHQRWREGGRENYSSHERLRPCQFPIHVLFWQRWLKKQHKMCIWSIVTVSRVSGEFECVAYPRGIPSKSTVRYCTYRSALTRRGMRSSRQRSRPPAPHSTSIVRGLQMRPAPDSPSSTSGRTFVTTYRRTKTKVSSRDHHRNGVGKRQLGGGVTEGAHSHCELHYGLQCIRKPQF